MIKSTQDMVLQASKETGYSVEILEQTESSRIRKLILQRYFTGMECRYLWEYFNTNNQVFSIRETESYKWIDEFIQNDGFYLFFDKSDDLSIYYFLENQSLAKFLEESYLDDFYITNTTLEYVICQNDHDYLIAAGTAEAWLRQKAIALSQTGWKDMDGRSFGASVG